MKRRFGRGFRRHMESDWRMGSVAVRTGAGSAMGD